MPIEVSDEYIRDCQRKHAREQKTLALLHTFKGVVILIAYTAFGAWFYGQKEGWDIIETLYFAAVTMTTIGYGDYVPTTRWSQIVTVLYAFVGIGIMYGSGAKLGDWLLARQDALAMTALRRMKAKVEKRKLKKQLQKEAEAAGETIEEKKKTCCYRVLHLPKNVFECLMAILSKLFQCGAWTDRQIDYFMPGNAVLVKKLAQALLPLFAYIFIGALIGMIEGWGFTNAFYFASMTVTTVGYGDFSPKNASGKAFCIIYCPLSVLVVGNVAINLRQLWQSAKLKDVTLFGLLKMDADQDGKVSRAEYMAAVLLSMGQARKSTLELIDSQFEYLDGDGNGYLDKNDLVRLEEVQITGLRDLMHLDEYIDNAMLEHEENEPAADKPEKLVV